MYLNIKYLLLAILTIILLSSIFNSIVNLKEKTKDVDVKFDECHKTMLDTSNNSDAYKKCLEELDALKFKIPKM